MKTLKFLAHVLGLFMLFVGTTTLARAQGYDDVYQQDGYATDGVVSLQTFYDELSPYGTWIQDPQYGYVWRPNVDQGDFRPYYTNGRWVMTEYGNTWVSNYDWGWAPFHYGRWVINRYRQWIWLPDTNWGPAWVDWRSGGGYYGWAPMAPTVGINISFGRGYVVPEIYWNFIPQASIYINVFPRYDYARNNYCYRNTTVINNTYVYRSRTYYGGPRMEDIRRATNRNVTVYRMSQSSRPGVGRVSGREVSIYRPQPSRRVDNHTAAPQKFERGNAGFGSRDTRQRQYGGGTTNPGNNNSGTITRPSRGNGGYSPTTDPARTKQVEDRGQQERMNQNQQRVQRDVQSDQQRAQQEQQQRAQRDAQMQQQRSQQEQQQRAQRDAQMQQQRSQQEQQQRAQRDAQMQQQRSQQEQQQRAQRDAQMQQQRSQQEQQQRAQRDAQMQQQRAQQEQQQRAQRDAQMQQQRSQQEQQRRSEPSSGNNSNGGRPSRGGRG
ncbi:DUF6600 domain-containing protein [Pedobacter sp. MW01-1-1]|uniref:DUF6600 domain-containing protein n=1 Tax=Pedobacter sp. MW01-1-1 TaxID=3383027 RepID=UPI003FEEF2DD